MYNKWSRWCYQELWWVFIRGACRDLFSSASWRYILAYASVQLSSVPSLHAEWSSDSISHDFFCRCSSVIRGYEQIPLCLNKPELTEAHVVFVFLFFFSSLLAHCIHIFFWLTLCLVTLYSPQHTCRSPMYSLFPEMHFLNPFFFFLAQCVTWNNTSNMFGRRRVKILGHELSRLKQWTCLGQKACTILSVFVDIISWGHICTDRLFDDYSAGLCFSRANADLRYIQSEMPSTLQPQSITVWLRTSTYFKRTLMSKRSFTSRKHAESKSWRNLSIMCIISGFLS